jgi:hypothetical protein
MLANNLTLDDEEAVQEEFRQLQALAVSFPVESRYNTSFDDLQAPDVEPERITKLPNVPDTEPVRVETPGTVTLYSFCIGKSLTDRPSPKNPMCMNQCGNECQSLHRTLECSPMDSFTCNINHIHRFLYDTIIIDIMPEI